MASLKAIFLNLFGDYENIRMFAYETIRKMKRIKPTEGELEILRVLWDKGTATVREVHETLTENKRSGYTTTLKLMQIMHEKGLVKRDTSARSHVYRAALSEKRAQKLMLDRLIHTLFGGSSSSLVMQALGHHKASPEEIEAIKAYLREMERPDDEASER